MTNVVTATNEQILGLLNLHLKNHPEFITGMSFDEVSFDSGRMEVRAHFFFDEDGQPTSETVIAQRVYNEVMGDFQP
ncbi:DUF2498 family protein [Vibrio jasicida]|uniref:DUF2498 family protein n=1 Tax=Vibrio jasicida TaxID=766224 RepID=UPI0003A7252F|nr:DUF2498 family protein [Vibrio jasicida]